MPNVDLSFAQDPNTLALAIIYGMVPAIAWLLFWLHEHRTRQHKRAGLFFAFLAGALAVIAVLPVEQFVFTLSQNGILPQNGTVLTILWAASEEFLKFIAFTLVVLTQRKKLIEEPIDYAIYIIVVALGFAGFENALYFLQPLQAGNTVELLLSGTMRFLGTTLMHAAAVGLVGIGLGFTFYKKRIVQVGGAVLGIAAGITLHSLFNLHIGDNNGLDFFQVFSYLWIATIVILVCFERLRRMGSQEYVRAVKIARYAKIETDFAKLLLNLGMTVVDTGAMSEMAEKAVAANDRHSSKLLSAFLKTLRAEYIGYLGAEGALPATLQSTILTVIPDTISPKAAESILTVIKNHDLKGSAPSALYTG